jgi:hypothetical protein
MSIIKKDMGFNRIKGDLKNLNRLFTKVGYPKEGDVAAGEEKNMIDIVRIAAIQEFGAPKRHIPERSHIRATFDAEKSKLKIRSQAQYKKVISGVIQPNKALGLIGEYLTNKTKAFIKHRIPPPLAPSTIEQRIKKSDVPLIDTAQMIQSIQHIEVVL